MYNKKLKDIANKNQWSIRKENDKYIINNNTVEIIEGIKIKVNDKFAFLRRMDELII